MIDLLDQQVDLTDPTNVGPRNNLPSPLVRRETMEGLHAVAATTRHRQTARLAEDVEGEDRGRAKDVVLCDAALVVERVGVAHALVYEGVFVAGRDPGLRYKVLVEGPYHFDVVRCILEELRHERTDEPYGRTVRLVHRDDLCCGSEQRVSQDEEWAMGERHEEWTYGLFPSSTSAPAEDTHPCPVDYARRRTSPGSA